MNQLETEIKYSKRMMGNLILESIIDDVPMDMMFNLLGSIEVYRSTQYYESKNVRISKLPCNEDIVNSLLTVVLIEKRAVPIQNPATKLGFMVGMETPLDAVKTGAELLAVCTESNLYDVLLQSDGTSILPKYSVDTDTRQKLDMLQYLPPMKQVPSPWLNNSQGGWLWERKSVILGKGNHHQLPQALDALNALQSVAWSIDSEVLVGENNPNKNMDDQQFLRIASEYIGLPFYFVWRFDKRGRSYSSGYDLNIQSNEYGKALMNLSNETVTKEVDNIKISVANCAGMDKITWQGRVDWFDAQGQFETEDWPEPILGRKAIRAYDRALEGKADGYVMHIDATASGLQVMAMLSGCKNTAMAANMIDPTIRHDVYSDISKSMNSKLGASHQVDRKMTKRPTLTHYYNSKAVPAEVFNEKQLEVFYEVLDDKFHGAEELMHTINQFWDYGKDHHQWGLPDGHIARVPVTHMVDARIEVDELDHRTFTYRYQKQEASKNFRSLVPNVVHSVDAYIAREMVRRTPFDLVHIHDCFVFEPDHLQEVCQTYREIAAEIAQSDLLSDILSQLAGRYTPVKKISDDLHLDILNSSYMLS
jgi:hypothetical protein